MNEAWKHAAGCLALALMPLTAVMAGQAADSAAAEAPPAVPAATAPATQEPPRERSVSIRIGAESGGAGAAAGTEHGVSITVAGTPDSAHGAAAAAVVDEVLHALEGKLDDGDMQEVRVALEKLEQADGDATDDKDDEAAEPARSHGVDWAEVVSPIAVFGSMVAVVFIVSSNNRRKRQMVHATLDNLIAQGRDVPVELLDALDKGNQSRSQLARGAVGIALGVGAGASLWMLAGVQYASLGLIPLCVGVARLIAWKLEGGDTRAAA